MDSDCLFLLRSLLGFPSPALPYSLLFGTDVAISPLEFVLCLFNSTRSEIQQGLDFPTTQNRDCSFKYLLCLPLSFLSPCVGGCVLFYTTVCVSPHLCACSPFPLAPQTSSGIILSLKTHSFRAACFFSLFSFNS